MRKKKKNNNSAAKVVVSKGKEHTEKVVSLVEKIFTNKIWAAIILIFVFGLVYVASTSQGPEVEVPQQENETAAENATTVLSFEKDVTKALIFSTDLPELPAPRSWSLMATTPVGKTVPGYLQGHRVTYQSVGGSVSASAISFAAKFRQEEDALAYYVGLLADAERTPNFDRNIDVAGEYNANCIGYYKKFPTTEAAILRCQKFNVFAEMQVTSNNFDSEAIAKALMGTMVDKIDANLEKIPAAA